MNTLHYRTTRNTMSRPRWTLLSARRLHTIRQWVLPAFASFFAVTFGGCGSSSSSDSAPPPLVAPAAVAPTITQQPSHATVQVGQSATLTVAADGTAPLSYQWERGGAPIAGATSTNYTTPPATATDSGAVFRVVVSNAAGSATSNDATLTVGASSALYQARTCTGTATTPHWCFMQPQPHAFDYDVVRFADANTVFASAEGTLVRSSDAGQTWQHRQGFFVNGIRAIAFATPTAGIFTGSPQNFYRSTDNGETLTAALPMSPGYEAVDFANANVGVALNASSAIRTADGGATWSAVNASGNGIDFSDANIGITVGAGGAILRSTDGGANWSAVTTPTTNTLVRVHFAGAIGVAVGESGTIVRSTDSGATWTVVASGTPENLLDVRLADANVAVAVGESGVVLRSVNGGVSWSAVSIGSLSAVRSIDFGSSTTGVLAGELGLLMRTTDGGATWTGYVPERLTGIETVHMNGNNGVAVGSQTTGLIEWTADGGATWNRVTGVSTNGLQSIFMPTPTVAVAGGEDNLLRSVDGGQTWSTVATSPSGATFSSIAFVDANVGVATGGNGGDVIRTVDGGLTWSVVATGNTNTLRGVHFSGNTGIAVGFSGTIIRTTNGGQTWSAVPSGTTNLLNHVQFASPTTVFVSGSNGNAQQILLRSTDAGLTWSTVALGGFNGALGRVRFANASIGAVMRSSSPFRTTDGGQTWTTTQTWGSGLPLNNLTDMHFSSPSTIVATTGVAIVRSTNGLP